MVVRVPDELPWRRNQLTRWFRSCTTEAATGGCVLNKAEPGYDLVPLGNIAVQRWFRGGSEVVPKSGTAVFPS